MTDGAARLVELADRASVLCMGSGDDSDEMNELGPETAAKAFAAAEELLAITSATTRRAAERWAAARAEK